ncbi:uncharacterized protein BYT42DRAFT_501146, partial [Radiomyces spectabilis]|uniref:uncharacterized protein n=1 Tax=Radiomyces spectabilis TaxID=64574 RepID=UPI00221EA7F5
IQIVTVGVIHHHHWACLQERTTVIPRSWATRKHWLQSFELIFCLTDMLKDQDALAHRLIYEHTGHIEVAEDDGLRATRLPHYPRPTY